MKSDFTTSFDKLLLCVQYLFGEHYPVLTGSCSYLFGTFGDEFKWSVYPYTQANIIQIKKKLFEIVCCTILEIYFLQPITTANDEVYLYGKWQPKNGGEISPEKGEIDKASKVRVCTFMLDFLSFIWLCTSNFEYTHSYDKHVCVFFSFQTIVVHPINATKEMKRVRKEMSESILPVVQKVYLNCLGKMYIIMSSSFDICFNKTRFSSVCRALNSEGHLFEL